MQGLHMVSRDGKCFYWVIFKLPTSWRSGQCVIAYFSCCVNFYKLPSSQEYLQFSSNLENSFAWLLDQYWEVLNPPSEKLTLPEVFPLFSKFLACHPILLFCNKYFLLDLACRWIIQSPWSRGILRIFALLDIQCSSLILLFQTWWWLVTVSTVFCSSWKWPA